MVQTEGRHDMRRDALVQTAVRWTIMYQHAQPTNKV